MRPDYRPSFARVLNYMMQLVMTFFVMTLAQNHVLADSELFIPKFISERDVTNVTSKDIAECLNHYIALGEEKSLVEFQALVTDWYAFSSVDGLMRNERIGMICNVLFSDFDDTKKRLRRLEIGSFLPECPDSVARNWPTWPLVRHGDTFLVMSRCRILVGIPEPMKNYIEFCQKNGQFRRAPFPLPTRERAIGDVQSLFKSTEWHSFLLECGVGDEDAGTAYFKKFLLLQAENIPSCTEPILTEKSAVSDDK